LEETLESGFCSHCGAKITNDNVVRTVQADDCTDDSENHIRIGYRGLFPKVLVTIDDKDSFQIKHNTTIKVGMVLGEHVLSLRTVMHSTGGELDRITFVATKDHDFLVRGGGKLKLKLKIFQLN